MGKYSVKNTKSQNWGQKNPKLRTKNQKLRTKNPNLRTKNYKLRTKTKTKNKKPKIEDKNPIFSCLKQQTFPEGIFGKNAKIFTPWSPSAN